MKSKTRQEQLVQCSSRETPKDVPTPPSRPADLGGSSSSGGEQSKAAPGTFGASRAAGDDFGQASKSVQKLMKMDESVQVGDNKYRIV